MFQEPQYCEDCLYFRPSSEGGYQNKCSHPENKLAGSRKSFYEFCYKIREGRGEGTLIADWLHCSGYKKHPGVIAQLMNILKGKRNDK